MLAGPIPDPSTVIKSNVQIPEIFRRSCFSFLSTDFTREDLHVEDVFVFDAKNDEHDLFFRFF